VTLGEVLLFAGPLIWVEYHRVRNQHLRPYFMIGTLRGAGARSRTSPPER
jgi:hypothetical protein